MSSTYNIQVSVIMPVYNSEKYLSGAVDSVLADKTKNFELILVDDGSTDASGSICDELASADDRVVVVHKKNGGMCAARNDALRIARGKYVTFADNDDEVLPGFIQDNLIVAEKYDADCVRFGRRMQRFNDKGEVARQSDAVPQSELLVEGDAIRRGWLKNWYGTDGVWAGMYSLDMLRNHSIEFPEEFKAGGEDCYFNDLVIGVADRVVYSPHVYYVWKQRAGHSSSLTVSESSYIAIRELLQIESRMISDYGISKDDPNAGIAKLFSRVKACLVLPSFVGFCKVERYGVYRKIRELLLPYHNPKGAKPSSSADKIMYSLLMSEHYAVLAVVLDVGVLAKSFVSR